jgi:CRP/FNR family cyclic AMP-dependent transcriptional regulator
LTNELAGDDALASSAIDFGRRLRACLHDRAVATSRVQLLKNESLYNYGERGNNLYLIECGFVKTLTLSRCGKECMLGVYTEGDVLGETALLTAERRETATAMVPTVLSQISRPQFLHVLDHHGLSADWLRYLTARLTDQQQVITYLVTADSQHRLAATLLRVAMRVGTRQGDTLRIEHRITQEELAGMVGTTRSRVGYFMKRFRCLGLISVTPDSFLVVNERLLSGYLES